MLGDRELQNAIRHRPVVLGEPVGQADEWGGEHQESRDTPTFPLKWLCWGRLSPRAEETRDQEPEPQTMGCPICPSLDLHPERPMTSSNQLLPPAIPPCPRQLFMVSPSEPGLYSWLGGSASGLRGSLCRKVGGSNEVLSTAEARDSPVVIPFQAKLQTLENNNQQKQGPHLCQPW